MRFVSITEISALGKTAVGAILTFGTLMQVPAIYAPITAFGHNHPHVASIIGTLTLLASLLANPQVQRIFGYTTPNGNLSTTPKP